MPLFPPRRERMQNCGDVTDSDRHADFAESLWSDQQRGRPVDALTVLREEHNLMDGVGRAELEEDVLECPLQDNHPRTIGSEGLSLLATLVGGHRRATPSRSSSNESVVSAASAESFWSNVSSNGARERNGDEHLSHRGGRRRCFMARAEQSNECEITPKGDCNSEAVPTPQRSNPFLGEESTVRRILRNVSWDGYSPATASLPQLLATTTDTESAAPTESSQPTSFSEDVWIAERSALLHQVQALSEQLSKTKSQLSKSASDTNWVATMEEQIRAAADEHRMMSQLVESLRCQIKEKDQDLTLLRLESLERGSTASFVSVERLPDTANHSEGSNRDLSKSASVDPPTIGWGTSSRWESPDLRSGSSSASRLLSVSADEYRELKIAKDTAMMRAGELAHQLAQAQGDVDDLQERLELTSQRLQAASVESVELKSRNDDLQSKVQWLEKQVQELKGRSSSNHGKGGVPRTPSSRLGQFLTRSSATKPSSIIPPSPLYRLSILTGSSPTSSSEPSLGTLPLTSRADDAVLDSPSETCERLAKPADCVGAADAATSEAVMEGIEDANTAMAAALLQLTQRVQRLEKEKAECLAALVESQNQVEFLLQRHPPHTSSSLESKDVPSNPTT